MFSKFLRQSCRLGQMWLLKPKMNIGAMVVRKSGDLIPPSQYDMPIPNRLKLGYVLRVYWETIPLFITTGISMTVLFIAIVWACGNKVDIVFSARSRGNISRTMDLRNPTCHKMLTVTQRYEPWPEMQDVLDKMKAAEHRAMVRAQSCKHA